MTFQQATRSLNLTTQLGQDAIQLIGFQGEEELSRLFISPGVDFVQFESSAEDIIGTNVSFSVDYDDGSLRHFNATCNASSL